MTNNQTNVLDTLHGLGLPPNLDEAEAQAWRRWLPGGRLPWRELASFETEIAELEERHREVERERDEIAARLQGAPAQDTEALAEWERSGRRGARPEPSQPKLEAELKRSQDHLYALHTAIDKVSTERVAHVEKHRARLVKEAGEVAGQAHERATRALDEAAEAREALVQARRVEVWARLYPDPVIGQEPIWNQLGGGLKRVLELLGTQNLIVTQQVLEALRADIDWIAGAVTSAQASKLEGSRPPTQDERERARDRQIDEGARLRRQLAADRRTGALEDARRKL